VADEYLRSYGDTNIKADIVGLIQILTAREDWFINNLGKTTAISTVHQTQTDTLRTVGSAAIQEGTDSTILASSTPTLVPNIVMHVGIPFAVSYVQQTVQHYSGTDELARQTQKALVEMGNELEYHLVRSTLTSGASGATPKMKGIVQAISTSTNTTVHNSGTALSATIINGLMRDNWNNGDGSTATDLFMGSFLRYVFDTFTQKTNQLIPVNASTIDNMIDIFQTSFGKVLVHTHRYVYQSSDLGRVLAVRPETLKVAYLNKPYVKDLAVTGPSTKKAVYADYTLEVKHQQSNWWAYGFDVD